MAQNSGKFVCYYRVSTGRQGRSGLGLEAQREAVTRFAANEDLEVAGEFIEVETGKKQIAGMKDFHICGERLPVSPDRSSGVAAGCFRLS